MAQTSLSPPAPTWLRTEAVIAGRLIILAAAGLLAMWLALRVSVITVAAFLAFAQAALLWPVVQKLSGFLPRAVASLLVLTLYVAAILALIWIILVQLVNAWPTLLSAVLGAVDAGNDWFNERGWSLPPELVDNLQQQLQARAGQLFSGLGGAALSGLGFLGSAATVMLVATFATLFALVGGEKMTQGIVGMMPASRRESAYAAISDGARTARWWMFASTVTGLVDGLLIGFGMHLLGVPLAFPIGLATFILGFIPMIGATLAGVIAVAVALFFGGISTGVATLVLVLAVQQIEGNVLSPLLLSRAMRFPPLLTLLTSTAGGVALGVAGLFLAVPVAGIATASVKAWRRERPQPGEVELQTRRTPAERPPPDPRSAGAPGGPAASPAVPDASPETAALPEGGVDVRLVVADMDGTLLDEAGRVPDGFWPLLEVMRERGIVFAPASGRQCATLARLFAGALDGMPLIAENGSYVVADGREISSSTIDREAVVGVVQVVRAATDRRLGVVVCGKRSAYVERSDEQFLTECAKYYAELAVVQDVLVPQDEILKIAVYDFDEAQESASLFEGFRREHEVVVSGHHWIDVMRAGVDKGTAVRALQASLGITRAQTVAFGDFLNDAQMLDEAHWSFAMADAHPEIRRRARYRAPSNREAGVVTVLRRLLGG